VKITRLTLTKNKKRVNVEIDGEFAFAIEQNTLIKFNLFKDREITEEEIVQIKNLDLSAFACRRAIDYLAKRKRSTKQISQYLEKLIEDTESKSQVIDGTITRLKQLKFLDDRSFAKDLIGYRIGAGKKSQKEIEVELIGLGIEKNIIDELIAKAFTKEKQLLVIEKLSSKKLRTSKMMQLSNQERKKKLTEFLLRKGFKWELVKQVISEI
jgi:regulatory protein